MTSLRRNREFNLLWASQSLSDLGTGIAKLALALLVLVQTGSPVAAGVVGTVSWVTDLLARLPAGVLADRLDRRRTMLACDGVRLVAFALLVAALLTHRAGLPLIVVVAIVDAAASALFSTVEDAALRTIVPVDQLPDAVARNEVRSYGTSLAGPPLGGLLFGLGRAVPFAANLVSYLVSIVAVLAVRKPLQSRDEQQQPQTYGGALAEGLRFVLGHPFLRALLLVAAPINFALNGAVFTMIVALQQNGSHPGVIGLVETFVAVGGLLGALAAPAVRRRFRLVSLIRMICGASAALVAASALLTTSIAGAIPIGVAVFLGPACNAALFGYQAAITPDRLQGRVISVIMVVATSLAAISPLLGGVVVHAAGAPAAIAVFAAALAGSALIAAFGRGLRWQQPAEAAIPDPAGGS